MTPLEAVTAVVVGLAAGFLSGLFGVGGGIVTTPAVDTLLGGTAIQAIATPLPVILPSTLVAASAYAKAGQLSLRAAWWAGGPGIVGAIVGALLTEVVNAHLLLLVTAALIALTSVQVIAGRNVEREPDRAEAGAWVFGAIGLVAGLVSGILGVGGGIVMVPAFTIWAGLPLKRALGTSLVVISILVVPGTIVHAVLGNVQWAIALAMSLGVVPGARLGARVALDARERTLRLAVGLFLLVVALVYGLRELVVLLGG